MLRKWSGFDRSVVAGRFIELAEGGVGGYRGVKGKVFRLGQVDAGIELDAEVALDQVLYTPCIGNSDQLQVTVLDGNVKLEGTDRLAVQGRQ